MRLALAILTLIGSLGVVGAADAVASARCLDGLRPALAAGGFSGSIDCQNDKLSIRHIGAVQKFGRVFQVYAYRYQLHPACPNCAIHGGQRIILMNGGRYVGQYTPDFVRVIIRHGDLLLVPTDSASGAPTTVRFTPDGPPKRLFVGGEVVSFFK